MAENLLSVSSPLTRTAKTRILKISWESAHKVSFFPLSQSNCCCLRLEVLAVVIIRITDIELKLLFAFVYQK